MKKKKRSGFTLVELLAVVVILGVTFMFVLPKMVGLISDSEDKEIELIEQRVLSAAKDYVNYIDGSFYTKLYKEGDTNYIYKTDLIKSGLIEEEEINKLDTLGGVKGELLSNDKIKYTVEYINASPSEYTNEELYLMIQNITNNGGGGSGSGGNIDSSDIDDLQSQINTTNDKIDNLTNKSNNDNIFLKTYHIGSIYVSTSSTNPGDTFGGTWEQVSEGRALFGAGELNGVTYTANTTIDAGLPNIEGKLIHNNTYSGSIYSGGSGTGAFYTTPFEGTNYYVNGRTTGSSWADMAFDASRYNAIYGKSETVQPNAYVVYMWKRTA